MAKRDLISTSRLANSGDAGRDGRPPQWSPFTDAFLRRLTVPKGKKDIVIFEHRSGLGVRKTDRGAVSFLIRLHLPDGRRWRETLRPQWPHLSLADARRASQVRTGDIAVGLDPFEDIVRRQMI